MTSALLSIWLYILPFLASCFVCFFVCFKLLCSSPPPPHSLHENCSFMVIVVAIHLCYSYFLIILISEIVTISKYDLGVLELIYVEILFLFQHLKIKLAIVLLFIIILKQSFPKYICNLGARDFLSNTNI